MLARVSAHVEAKTVGDTGNITPRENEKITQLLKLIHSAEEEERSELHCSESSGAFDAGTEGGRDDHRHGILRRSSTGYTSDEHYVRAYRYLRGNGFNLRMANEALRKTAAFRQRHCFNSLVLFPSLIPIRGYDERHVCSVLGLPFLEGVDGSLSAVSSGVSEGAQLNDSMQLKKAEFNRCSSKGDQHVDMSETIETNDPLPALNPEYSGASYPECGKADANVVPGQKPSLGLLSRLCNDTFAAARRFQAANEASRTLPTDSAPSVGSCDLSSDRTLKEMEQNQEDNRDDLVVPSDAQILRDTADNRLVEQLYSPNAGPLNYHAFLLPIVRAVAKYFPFNIHYWDKTGHPVLYGNLGCFHSRKLYDELRRLTPVRVHPRALAMLFYVYTLEVVHELIRYRNRCDKMGNVTDCGVHITQYDTCHPVPPRQHQLVSCVVVLNAAGMRLRRSGDRSMLSLVRCLFLMSQEHYPELLSRLFVINCSSVVSLSYLAVRPVLSDRLRTKIVFCTRKTTNATLRESIDPAYLPVELGGTCSCRDGCIPLSGCTEEGRSGSPYTASNLEEDAQGSTYSGSDFVTPAPLSDSLTNTQTFKTNRIVIGPRKKHNETLELHPSDEVVWDFEVEQSREVIFSVFYIPISNAGETVCVVPAERVETGANHFISPGAGVLLMQWKSTNRFLHHCRLLLRLWHDTALGTFPTPV